MTTPRRLGDQHFGLASTAVDAYARHARLTPTEARRELEEYLADARQQSDPDRWRARSRTTGLDLLARTVHDAARGHLVVIGVSVREVAAQRRGGDRERTSIVVALTPDEHAEIVAELRGSESAADLLRASGLATARARARARARAGGRR